MPTIAIVESHADSASSHICDHLRSLAEWTEREDETRPAAAGGGTYYRIDSFELRSFEDLHLDLESPAAAFDCEPDLLVFASRHSGNTGPLLTAHFTGNFGPAEYGGDDHALAETCPNALARLLEAFDEYAPDGYDVGMECTHHGPTDVGCPSLFAELGSDREQWENPEGAEAVARAILALRGVEPHRPRQVVGFGGGHYVPRFERIVRETPWNVGHVASEWALEAMGSVETHHEVLESAFETSQTELAVLDGEWPKLESTLEELGYRVVSETWLRTVGDRPREIVSAVETELGPVSEGVRFGERLEESFAVRSLPTDLLGVTEGIDPDRVRTIVERETVAFETSNGGSRIGERAAVPTPADESLRAIVESLAALLEEKYDEVRLESDAVIAEELAFDPALARAAGVPEGPQFGALSKGESVTVAGETIDPEAVHTTQTRRFPLPPEGDDE